MLPVLFEGSIFEIPTYYVLYLLAFLGAILLLSRRAPRYGLSPVRAIDFGFFCFLFGILGARLFHIVLEAPHYYLENPVRVFYFWQGGFVLYGGILTTVLAMYFVVRAFGESFPRWADLAAAPLMLGIGIGRMGCLSAGCCHGNRTHWFWGMIFNHPRSGAPLNIPLHPTQAVEALFGFVMCIVFLWIYRNPPKREGEAICWAIFSYAVFRFVLEFLRGDLDRGIHFQGYLSTSQIISIGLVVGCLLWFSKFRKSSV